jgi:glycosyltransferase involved in cell wall biosynthesis
MKILVVHQYYLGPGQPGGSRFNEFARLWAESGHEVTVIAGNLNYATGEVPEHYRGQWYKREMDGDVQVWRCHVPATYGRSYMGRMWAFLGFTLSSVTAAMRVGRPDVVIATSPPLVAAIPGWVVARCRGRRVPLIFEIRDLWPESAITTNVLRRDSLLTKMLFALERWACRKADRVNVLTPAFRDDIVRRGLATPDKVVFVPNGADARVFQPARRDNAVRRAYGWGDRFVVMYAGAHGRANAVGQLLEAASLLGDRPEVLIACVGDGPERSALQEEARGRGLTNIMFCGPQPKDRMPEFVNACDVGAAVLQNNPTFRTVYPNKVFDYMACERPTLLAIDGVARTLVCEEARAGVFAEPENGPALAAAIRQLADDPSGRDEMGRRGREWLLANATRESLARRYLEVMAEVTAAG